MDSFLGLQGSTPKAHKTQCATDSISDWSLKIDRPIIAIRTRDMVIFFSGFRDTAISLGMILPMKPPNLHMREVHVFRFRFRELTLRLGCGRCTGNVHCLCWTQTFSPCVIYVSCFRIYSYIYCLGYRPRREQTMLYHLWIGVTLNSTPMPSSLEWPIHIIAYTRSHTLSHTTHTTL